MTTIEKTDLINKRVTLNGAPAIISGRLQPFAMVRRLDGSQGYEFAWETVRNIVKNRNGEFRGWTRGFTHFIPTLKDLESAIYKAKQKSILPQSKKDVIGAKIREHSERLIKRFIAYTK